MGQGGRQPAGDVVGDVDPADGDRIRVHQFAIEEDGDGRSAAAHIDADDAHLLFILDQAGEPGRIGRRYIGLEP